MQRANFVADAQHDARAILAGGRTALAAQHQKPRGIGGIVLDIAFENAQAVMFGRQRAGNGRGILFLGGEFGRARVGGGLDDFDVRQMGLHPATALRQSLGMGIKFFDLLAACSC